MIARAVPALLTLLLAGTTTIASAAATPKFSPGEYNMAITIDNETHDTPAIVEISDGKVIIKKKSNPADTPFSGVLVGDQLTAEAKGEVESIQLKGKLTADDTITGEAAVTRSGGPPRTVPFKLTKVAK